MIPEQTDPRIDTAMAGILALLQDDLHGRLDSKDLGIPSLVEGIRGALEALAENVTADLAEAVRSNSL